MEKWHSEGAAKERVGPSRSRLSTRSLGPSLDNFRDLKKSSILQPQVERIKAV